jgi:hypothetical protein
VSLWALFELKPVDGYIDMQAPRRMEVYVFDWKPGMQYWWTCEYDAGVDRYRMEGKEIAIVDRIGYKKALAVYANWGISKIMR